MNQLFGIPACCVFVFLVLPSIEARFGRMVTAPSATSSSSVTGELFAPQLSDPTNRKWPVRLARFAASRTRLPERDRKNQTVSDVTTHEDESAAIATPQPLSRHTYGLDFKVASFPRKLDL